MSTLPRGITVIPGPGVTTLGSTIPLIDRLIEYCDALELAATGELRTLGRDDQALVADLLMELRSYIEGVVAAEIDELCDRAYAPQC